MKLKTILLFLILSSASAFSQIGINTEHPQTDLDVNGDMTLRGPFKINPLADAGKSGDILVSQGTDSNPQWTTLHSVNMNNVDYILSDIKTITLKDGLVITDDTPGFSVDENSTTTNWYMMSPETMSAFTVSVENDNSLLIITLQTSVQSLLFFPDGWGEPSNSRPPTNTSLISSAASSYVDYVGGIFMLSPGSTQANLISASKNRLVGYRNPQGLFNIYHIEQLTQKGDYTFRIGFNRLDSNDLEKSQKFIIGSYANTGTSGDNPSTNEFMNKTVFRIDIYSPLNK